jgi:methionine synthase I (cobalamin-dependent)
VRMVGGCCGTTPQHIAGLRKVLDIHNERMD